MEGHLLKSPNLGHPADSSDAKYVSGLSTILVATIQETKDRISQIEYIFCSQLFPKFQQNAQSLQKIYSEAKEAAEDAHKEKEKGLLLQIKKLQCQNQQVLEDNQFLKLEKTKLMNMENESCNRLSELQEELNKRNVEANERKEVQENLHKLLESKSSLLHSYEKTTQELEEKNIMLLRMQKKLEVDSVGLQHELMKKSKEVDDMMELQNKLLQENQFKSSLVVQKETQLNEYIEKTNGLLSKVENMESKVNELLSGLKDKVEEVEKGKELQTNLLKKIEFQASEIMNNEQLLNKYEKENRLLSSKVSCLTNSADELQKELNQKTSELDEIKRVQEQLLQKCDSFNFDIVKRGKAPDEVQEEKKSFLNKQKCLGDEVNKLQQSLSEKCRESSEGAELQTGLLQQIEVKDSELLSEKRKKRDVIIAYKKLKSQYSYLLKKYNITQETIVPLEKVEGENEAMRYNFTPVQVQSHGIVKPVDDHELSEDKRKVTLVKGITPTKPSTTGIHISPVCPSSSKPCPPAGTKRPNSYWRDTRSHQSRVGPDLHDDFLDTPLENVRENLGKATEDLPKSDAVNTNLDDSDDQTQDINPDVKPNKQHKSPTRAGTSGFKYVEPVRKKSERENLKGVECKQCKKFYDAVLPDGSNKQNVRCEHHDGVSRHRYRYAPPSTPEGFWNIGFESEM